jgi:hypothetical protein
MFDHEEHTEICTYYVKNVTNSWIFTVQFFKKYVTLWKQAQAVSLQNIVKRFGCNCCLIFLFVYSTYAFYSKI